MAKSKLEWTGKQKEVAELLRQGKTAKDIIASGYTHNLVFKVQRALKNGDKQEKPKTPAAPSLPTPGRSQTPPQDPAYVTKYRIDTLEPQTLGAIQALPEDWRISQHGVFLLLDTFYLSKEEIGYEGTMGEFITDVMLFYRALMQYSPLREVGPPLPEIKMIKEKADDGTGTSTTEGTASPGQDGGGVSEEGDGDRE